MSTPTFDEIDELVDNDPLKLRDLAFGWVAELATLRAENERLRQERDSLARRCAVRFEETEKLRSRIERMQPVIDAARVWKEQFHASYLPPNSAEGGLLVAVTRLDAATPPTVYSVTDEMNPCHIADNCVRSPACAQYATCQRAETGTVSPATRETVVRATSGGLSTRELMPELVDDPGGVEWT